MTQQRIHPVRNAVYTFREICECLDLRDSPFLRFYHNDTLQVVQMSHVCEATVLAIPGWAESRWKFQRETDEWIPLFITENVEAVLPLVDMEPYIDPFAERAGIMWVVPKGTEREQYYSLNEDGYIVSPHGELYAAPVFDEDGYPVR